MAAIKHVKTATLDIAYEESGAGRESGAGEPLILLHGFPYDPRAYDGTVAALVAAGHRVIVPYLRGYGSTRFLSPATPRSGQQAALGKDLLDLMDALQIPKAALLGYDWGGRAACVVAALWPQRVRCLVSVGGYNIQDIAASVKPLPPEQEHRYWYQYYFHTERGRAGLAANRYALCRLLWQLWSPNWRFDEAVYAASAKSFDNQDFVDVVIQSYRHRYSYAPGDPAVAHIERQLEQLPNIAVPALVLHGAGDGVAPAAGSVGHAAKFTGFYERRVVPVAGHNLPQEEPQITAQALLDLLARC